MIGIVLVTHGNLAREFITALEHVVGPQQCVAAVCIGSHDDMEKRRAEILECAKTCDTDDGARGRLAGRRAHCQRHDLGLSPQRVLVPASQRKQ